MSDLVYSQEYKDWFSELKRYVKSSQIKAKLSVNSQMIIMYWNLGSQINEKLENSDWGSKLIDNLSQDLKQEFPEMKGFSRTNLYYIKRFHAFYSEIVQQAVGQLEDGEIIPQYVGQIDENEIIHQAGGQFEDGEIVHQAGGQIENVEIVHQVSEELNKIIILCSLIPWRHNIAIMEKCKSKKEVLFYLKETSENNWSRAVLEHQIESGLYKRKGKAVNNFSSTLPQIESDLANEIMKDPYHFDFLNLTDIKKEKDLESNLIDHISKFLMELGKGFAYMGRQYKLVVGSKEYYLDLLFYHTKLKCHVIIELKIIEFQPEFIGKLNFYINAIDELVKDNLDKPSIGILLCKNKDNYEVEFALKGLQTPIGVSEYRVNELPDDIKPLMPSKKEWVHELGKFGL